MKYLLKFNENTIDLRLPKEVSEKEFFNKKGIFKMRDFTDVENKQMCNILNEKRKKSDIRWTLSYEFIEIHKGNRQSWEIVKLDDDWFTIIYSYWNTDCYFICDEFEEVINYMNSI